MARSSTDQKIIEELKFQLRTGHAHATLDKVLEGIPFELLSKKPGNSPYSIWQLAVHIRITQWDILDFSRNPKYKYIEWPDSYWPAEDGPADTAAWEQTVKQIKDDRESFIGLIDDEKRDIYEPFPWGKGQTLLRETNVIVDHNGHHCGQIILLRRMLGAWE